MPTCFHVDPAFSMQTPCFHRPGDLVFREPNPRFSQSIFSPLVPFFVLRKFALIVSAHPYNLGRLVTSIFLSMGHFLDRFSTFCEKMKKIYPVEV